MIDRKEDVNPESLKAEAFNLEYTGRAHHAQIMRWAAERLKSYILVEKEHMRLNGELRERIAELKQERDELAIQTTNAVVRDVEMMELQNKHNALLERLDTENRKRFPTLEGYSRWQHERIGNLQKRIAELEAVMPLLKAAACPNCDGSGAYYTSDGTPAQCQWCDEREQALEQKDECIFNTI